VLSRFQSTRSIKRAKSIYPEIKGNQATRFLRFCFSPGPFVDQPVMKFLNSGLLSDHIGTGNLMTALIQHRNWLLRLALASVFIFHGLGKFIGPGGIGGFSEMTGLPTMVALLVALAEVAGGFGILVGGFGRPLITRLSGLAVIPVMLGAIGMVHWGRWNFVASDSHPMGGMEFQVVLLLIAAWFALGGGHADKA
jgi:putative oxidoreductase